MPEHRIALRRAWDCQRGDIIGRVNLPAIWGAGEAPTRLTRRFQRPSRLGPSESLWLEFASTSGLLAASLNGIDLGIIPSDDHWAWPIADREVSTFQLMLRVDPGQVPATKPWGDVSLVIRF